MNINAVLNGVLSAADDVFPCPCGLVFSERDAENRSFVIRLTGVTYERSMLATGCVTAYQCKITCVYTFNVDNRLTSFADNVGLCVQFMNRVIGEPGVTSVTLADVDFDETDELGYAIIEVVVNGVVE